MDHYHDIPTWRKMYLAGILPPNEGHYKYFAPESAMLSPIFLYSNEYSYTQMKGGKNDFNNYRGGVHRFAPSVDGSVRRAVNCCTAKTGGNAAGCQNAAIRQIFEEDLGKLEERLVQGKIIPKNTAPTSHPFEVSWNTGARPHSTPRQPDTAYADYFRCGQ